MVLVSPILEGSAICKLDVGKLGTAEPESSTEVGTGCLLDVRVFSLLRVSVRNPGPP